MITKQPYVPPAVTSLTGRQVVEALGHPMALVYGQDPLSGVGD